MRVQVRVLPGTVLHDNRSTYHPGDELEMDQAEANRRIKQGKVEMAVPADDPGGQAGSRISAAEKIEAVKVAASITALAGLREGEDRKTVLAAIEQRVMELGS